MAHRAVVAVVAVVAVLALECAEVFTPGGARAPLRLMARARQQASGDGSGGASGSGSIGSQDDPAIAAAAAAAGKAPPAASPPIELTHADCLVVGAGLSGCSLAHHLHRHHGVDVLLAEARSQVGGNVRTRTNDQGYLWEEGPNSFAATPGIVRLAHELGISGDLVFADESLPPYVFSSGKLHPLPKGQGGKGPAGQLELVFGPNGILKFGLESELLSWPGKLRAAAGAFLGHAPPPEGKDETIRDWVTRTLGEEVKKKGAHAELPPITAKKRRAPSVHRWLEDNPGGVRCVLPCLVAGVLDVH
jgi:hypothetical protein